MSEQIDSNMVRLIIPAYNEERTLKRNMETLAVILDAAGQEFTAVLVDDGSRDATWSVICELRRADARFNGVRFSRNFGKEAAVFAGVAEALRLGGAEWFAVLDSDLQHPPQCIPEMLALARESGADVVDGVKRSRGSEKGLYHACASLFYSGFKWFAGADLGRSSDFKLLSRRAALTLTSFKERDMFFRGICEWMGLRHVEYEFDVADRTGDTSRFSTGRLIRFACSAALSFSVKPLYFAFVAGALFLLGALLFLCFGLFLYALVAFTGGAILFVLGVLGAYIARMYSEVRGRPRYILERSVTDAE